MRFLSQEYVLYWLAATAGFLLLWGLLKVGVVASKMARQVDGKFPMTTFSDGWHLHGGKANNGEKIETHMLDQEAYAKELNKIAKISAILSLAAFVGFLISALD